jgi:chromate transport protein ChrA
MHRMSRVERGEPWDFWASGPSSQPSVWCWWRWSGSACSRFGSTLRRHRPGEQPVGAVRAGQTSRAIRTVFAFIGITVMGLAVALLVPPVSESLPFLGLILASTVTSFGGGEAYVGVADGFFVASGMVDTSVFYGQVVPIANALPGPILVKIAAGVAFLIGGWALAGAAFFVAAASCSAIAVGVLAGYDRARNSLLIRNVSTYILPVICGLLASTAVSMLYSQRPHRRRGECATVPHRAGQHSRGVGGAVHTPDRQGTRHRHHSAVRRDQLDHSDAAAVATHASQARGQVQGPHTFVLSFSERQIRLAARSWSADPLAWRGRQCWARWAGSRERAPQTLRFRCAAAVARQLHPVT